MSNRRCRLYPEGGHHFRHWAHILVTCGVVIFTSRLPAGHTPVFRLKKVKVKASYARYRAFGLELILVWRQSVRKCVSHPPGGRLPLLPTRPAVTWPAAEHQHPLASTRLYCLVTEAHRCEQLAQGCYAALLRVGFEPMTY